MNVREQIKTLIEQTSILETESKKKEIILLTNTRGKTTNIGNLEIQFAEETEFFKEEEYDEILEGLKLEGYYINSYFNEIIFINDIINNKLKPEEIVVYNLARNGNREGKKSLIPSFCDLLHIPYTGSNAFVMSLCRNKYAFSHILKSHKIPVPNSWLYLGDGLWADGEPKEGTKIIVKPAFESASIGLSLKNVFTYLAEKITLIDDLYKQNDSKPIIIQEFISGYECEIPFFRYNEVPVILDPVGISINGNEHLDEQILTQELSDNDNYQFYNMSKILPRDKILQIKENCKCIALILGITNYGRIDCRIDNNGNFYITDIATTPFTTKHSSMAYIFEKNNIPFSKIFAIILSCVQKY
ncbi:MAG: hypothetical protein ACK5MV_04310 [Aminipila sp.]